MTTRREELAMLLSGRDLAGQWETLDASDKQYYHDIVADLLKAMREPNEHQRDTLSNKGVAWEHQTSEGMWHTYIDALLEEPLETTYVPLGTTADGVEILAPEGFEWAFDVTVP